MKHVCSTRHMKGKAINRDLWMMILKLATEVSLPCFCRSFFKRWHGSIGLYGNQENMFRTGPGPKPIFPVETHFEQCGFLHVHAFPLFLVVGGGANLAYV